MEVRADIKEKKKREVSCNRLRKAIIDNPENNKALENAILYLLKEYKES